jgi:hypothetical protein
MEIQNLEHEVIHILAKRRAAKDSLRILTEEAQTNWGELWSLSEEFRESLVPTLMNAAVAEINYYTTKFHKTLNLN